VAQAKSGDTVIVHYTGRLEDETQFDSSVGGDPLEFTLGNNQVLLKFEETVVGMEPGESRTVTIVAADAYGDHREDLVAIVARDQFPPNIDPEIGIQLELRQADGSPIPVTITSVDDDQVTLDANHPLAGENLHFAIELVEIK